MDRTHHTKNREVITKDTDRLLLLCRGGVGGDGASRIQKDQKAGNLTQKNVKCSSIPETSNAPISYFNIWLIGNIAELTNLFEYLINISHFKILKYLLDFYPLSEKSSNQNWLIHGMYIKQ